MTKVKICGLLRVEDINYVNEVLPDYVGFIFAKSRRQVKLDEAAKLINLLDKSIKTVGVFVDEEVDKVKEIAEKLSLNILQFHGKEDETYINQFNGFSTWKSVAIKVDLNKETYNREKYQKVLDSCNKYNIEGILLDSSVKGAEGGTGVSFDWSLIPKLNINKKLILAGGLNPSNVRDAIDRVKPYAVDVSSGVETDGFKDFNKIKKFMEKVRNK